MIFKTNSFNTKKITISLITFLFLTINQVYSSDDNWFHCQKSNQNNGYIISGGHHINGNPLSAIAYSKIDLNGNIVWQKGISGNSDEVIPYSLNKGQSNYYTCGLSYANGFGVPGDAYVLAFDENGNKVWDWLAGEVNAEFFYGVCEKNNGEVIATGFTKSFSTIDDLMIVKLDVNGNVTNSKIIFNNTNNTEIGLKAKSTNDGGYIIMGTIRTSSLNDLMLIKFNSNDNISWAKRYGIASDYDPIDIIESSNGNFIIAGANIIAGNLGNNLLRVTALGNVLWFKTYSTNVLERPSQVSEQNGNIYVSGMVLVPGTAGILDAQYFATDVNGDLLFSNKINVNGFDGKRIGCIETDAINQNEITMVTGEFISTPRLFDVGLQKVSMHSNACNNTEYPLTEGTLNVTETSLNLNQQNISLFEFNGFGTQNINEFSDSYCEQDVYPYFEVDVNPCTGAISTTNLSTNGVSYSWNFGNGGTSTATNPTYTYNNNGTYTITLYATDNMGNTDWYDVEVTIGGGGNFANAGNNVSMCQGSSITLNASGGNSYSWSPSTGLSNANIANPTASPNSTTTYTVTVNSGNGCTDTDQVTVTVNSAIANAGNNVSMCQGSLTTLNASGGNSYSWSPSGGLSNANIANPTASPNSTTTYTVTVTNANGCTDTDQVTVTVNSANANAGNNVSICQGSSTTLNASGGNSYFWTPSFGLSNSNVANPTASPNSTTTYTVIVTDGNGCTDTDQVTITVNTLPNPNFSLPITSFNNSPITLTASPSGGVFSGNGVVFNAFNPSIAGTGQHLITYTYTDNNGCTASVSNSIFVFTITYNFVNYNLGTIAP